MDSGAALQDEERQRVFYDRIREWIVSMLMVVLLYLVSYWIVARYKKSRHREECYSGDEDALVYRISTWLCSFALCVSVGSVLLLPLSILTNEVLLLQPHSHYLRWINTSLIRGLWNQVFLGCNLSLFLLLPFAYFFVESEGMAGWRKGLVSRVCETVILLGLLAAMALVLTWLFSALLLSLLADYEVSSRWLSPLPLLYTLVSMLGVLLMALCTPVGISRLFSLLGHLITKPKLRGVVQDELVSVRMEEAALQRRLKLGCGGQQSLADLLEEVKEKRLELERHVRSSQWERRVAYPLAFLLLLASTCLALLMVACNLLSLCLGLGADPPSLEALGQASVSYLGPLGALLQVTIIVYVVCAGVVGLYSTPPLSHLLPTPGDTSMTKLIGNCILLLLLSSALPLLTKTLGLTRFNLFGWFGQLTWLGNAWVVFVYNAIFFSLTLLILCKHLTSAVLHEAAALLRPRLPAFRPRLFPFLRRAHKPLSHDKSLHMD